MFQSNTKLGRSPAAMGEFNAGRQSMIKSAISPRDAENTPDRGATYGSGRGKWIVQFTDPISDRRWVSSSFGIRGRLYA